MVRQIIPPIAPVEIGRQIGNSGLAHRMQHETRIVSLHLPHPGGLRRINRKRWDESERYNYAGVSSHSFQNAAERQDVCLFKTLQHRMPLFGYCRLIPGLRTPDLAAQFRCEPQISMQSSVAALAPVAARRSMSAEQVSQPEIRPRISPFVVTAARATRNQSASALDKLSDR